MAENLKSSLYEIQKEGRKMLFYDNGRDYREEFRNFWNENVRKYRRHGLIAGIIMLVLGILCLFFPVRSMLVMEILASIALIVVGFLEIVGYMSVPVYLRLGGSLLSGILNVILGILLLTSSSEAMLATFAFLIAIEMMAFGISQLAAANRMKFYGASDTGWLTASGILNLVIACIFIFLPQASIAISIIIAIYLLIAGIALIYGAWNSRELHID